MEEYGIMEYLELTVTRCGRWTGNREFIWSGLNCETCNWPGLIIITGQAVARAMVNDYAQVGGEHIYNETDRVIWCTNLPVCEGAR